MNHEALFMEMIQFYAGDPKQIQHFMKVHSFARRIALAEQVDEKNMNILEAAAIVHDVGIKPALQKHGSGSGKYQEQEGPPLAESMLHKLGYPEEVIQRVAYLVGHHHTFSSIDGLDYQILVEADFLVNFDEAGMSKAAIQNAVKNIFKTKTGLQLCRWIYGPPCATGD